MPKSPVLSRIITWIFELRKWCQDVHGRFWRNRGHLKQRDEEVPLTSTGPTSIHHAVPKAKQDAPKLTEILSDHTSTSGWLCFWPTSAALFGYITEPKGRPTRGGSYSNVWCCEVVFRTRSEGLPTKVAVKVLRFTQLDNSTDTPHNEQILQRFQQEGITWFGLLDHPNIVPLIGWTLSPTLAFISPWYEQGNLHGRLRHLSGLEQIKLLIGVAKGLEYLHPRNPPVIHGDLKPENILISDEGEPLLTDFGLSTVLGEERMYTSSHRVGGSLPWMSPECVVGAARSCQSDIYSFGSLTFTVVTGELPHAGLTDGQIILKVCDRTNPKDPVEDWSKYHQAHGSIKDLLKDCWSRLPEARPSMPKVIVRLSTLLP